MSNSQPTAVTVKDAGSCTVAVAVILVGATAIIATAIGCIAFLRWLCGMAVA